MKFEPDSPQFVRRLVGVLAVLCVAVVGADFVIHRHAEFAVEGLPGFYALFGFGAYCCIVLGAKSLRRFLHRPQDYYDD